MADTDTQHEHSIPVAAFVKTLRGTADEVYSRLLIITHSHQNKTARDWRASLDALRGLPPVKRVPDPIKGSF